jgi:hypothetical protein
MANSVAIQSPRGSLIQLAGNAGTDPFLWILPVSWSEWSCAEGYLFGSFPVACVAGFLCNLVNDKSAPVQPSTAINYLSAVRFNLLTNGLDVGFMDDSIVLQKTRTGLMNFWRSVEGNLVADLCHENY